QICEIRPRKAGDFNFLVVGPAQEFFNLDVDLVNLEPLFCKIPYCFFGSLEPIVVTLGHVVRIDADVSPPRPFLAAVPSDSDCSQRKGIGSQYMNLANLARQINSSNLPLSERSCSYCRSPSDRSSKR